MGREMGTGLKTIHTASLDGKMCWLSNNRSNKNRDSTNNKNKNFIFRWPPERVYNERLFRRGAVKEQLQAADNEFDLAPVSLGVLLVEYGTVSRRIESISYELLTEKQRCHCGGSKLHARLGRF